MSMLSYRCALTVALAAAACLSGGGASIAADGGVLVLRNGRLVRGRISQSAGGFMVDVRNGRMMVPYSQVRFQAVSTADAYRRLRDAVPNPSPSYRLALAKWCVTNELYDYALREVNHVLKSDPEHVAAGRMKRRVEAMLSPKTNRPKKKTLYERLAAPDVTALAGLSPHVAKRFVGRVQPILMNGCALAGCHGPRSSNGFQLTRVRLSAGNRRGVSERNLAATLRFVNVRFPSKSPLLNKPLGNHGRRGKAVFRGRAGAKQIEELRSWVRMVAADSTSPETGPSSTASRRTEPPQRNPNTGGGRQTGFGVRSPLPRFQATPAMKAARSRVRTRRPVGEPTRGPKRRPASAADPFDPAEFNRRAKSAAGSPFPPSRSPGRFR
ncbi:MAG: hypothetical protein ACE5KM_18140 [Planctomycetaceae bacterium]